MSGKPVRLRLSRREGFDLQAHSQAINGLPAIKVTSLSFWGSPFRTRPGSRFRAPDGRVMKCIVVSTTDEALQRFRNGLLKGSKRRKRLAELRGKNLACWCALDAACHADVLLELANAPLSTEAGR